MVNSANLLAFERAIDAYPPLTASIAREMVELKTATPDQLNYCIQNYPKYTLIHKQAQQLLNKEKVEECRSRLITAFFSEEAEAQTTNTSTVPGSRLAQSALFRMPQHAESDKDQDAEEKQKTSRLTPAV